MARNRLQHNKSVSNRLGKEEVLGSICEQGVCDNLLERVRLMQ